MKIFKDGEWVDVGYYQRWFNEQLDLGKATRERKYGGRVLYDKALELHGKSRKYKYTVGGLTFDEWCDNNPDSQLNKIFRK